MEKTSDHRSIKTFDTGKGSLIYKLLAPEAVIRPIKPARYVVIYILTILIFYGVGLVWAAISTPSLTTAIGEFKRPYLKDIMLIVMLCITLPVALCIHLRERYLIPDCLSQLFRNGVIIESESRVDEFILIWEKRFRFLNVMIQIVSLLVVAIVVLLNYKTFVDDPYGWQHFGAGIKSIAPIGWWSLFAQIGVLFFVISIVILRIPVIIWLLWSLRNFFSIKVRPLHPDGVGGLHPVAKIAFQGQIFLTLLGINIATNYVQFSMHGANQPWYIIIVSVIAYVLVTPIIFIGPLLPFRIYMKNEKYKLLDSISSEYDNEITDIKQLLHSTDSNYRLEKLEKLTVLHKSVSKFPEWPLDTSTLREFITSLIIPLLVGFLSTLFNYITN